MATDSEFWARLDESRRVWKARNRLLAYVWIVVGLLMLLTVALYGERDGFAVLEVLIGAMMLTSATWELGKA